MSSFHNHRQQGVAKKQPAVRITLIVCRDSLTNISRKNESKLGITLRSLRKSRSDLYDETSFRLKIFHNRYLATFRLLNHIININ